MDKRLADYMRLVNRRQFLGQTGAGLGAIALGSLLGPNAFGAEASATATAATAAGQPGLPGYPHFAPKAKRVIYLFQGGGPSQLETFDYKPLLQKYNGQDLPASIRMGQRLTAMSATQAAFPCVPSMFKFAQAGQSGAWVSELMPHTAKIVDDVSFIKSMYTEQINHDPAVTFTQTGFQLAGRPSLGSWVSYGLGSENADLPAFCVMVTGGGQALSERMWGTGFLPTRYQGVKLRAGADPVLYISNPEGFDRGQRENFMSRLQELDGISHEETSNPEILTRIAQYEMAFRMQASVPELTDMSKEPAHTFELYGEDARKPGTFAANCLMARRLAERGVRFIQLYHRAWDHHAGLPGAIRTATKETDQASAGLIQDLKERGLLDDTLVIWGGEFGRTVYCQGKMTETNYGRDHHPRCYSIWMAGGGVKAGYSLGETDDYSYNVTKDPVHVHDLNATILNLLGIDHTRLTYKYQGRHFRLTDVHGEVVKQVIA
jgi:hypothetical protein